MTVSLWSRFGVCYSHSSRSARVWFIAFMGDGPYANTRHHAIRRLAAEAQLQANSVVTPAALGGRPPRMAAVPQDQGPLQQLLSSSFGVPASTAEQAASRSQRGLPGSRGQRDDGGAPTPTSRGAPLSPRVVRRRHWAPTNEFMTWRWSIDLLSLLALPAAPRRSTSWRELMDVSCWVCRYSTAAPVLPTGAAHLSLRS